MIRIPVFCMSLALSVFMLVPAKVLAVTVATWNMEHLADNNGVGCKPRTASDYVKLKKYAEGVDADVYAVQEIQSSKALAKVFDPEVYDFYVSSRASTKPYACKKKGKETGQLSTDQKVAWVVKKSLSHEYDPSKNITSLDINTYLRYGLVLRLPKQNLLLVNLHLKSSCHNGGIPSYDSGCTVKQVQFERLGHWLNEYKGKETIVLLGDWNHKFKKKEDFFLKNNPKLTVATKALKSCNPKYLKSGKADAGVDHILVKGSNPKVKMHNFSDANGDGVDDDEAKMLSDHCAISAKF